MIRKSNVKLKKNNGYDRRSLVDHSIPFNGGAVKLENSLISKSPSNPATLQPGEFFPADGGGDANPVDPSTLEPGSFFPADGGGGGGNPESQYSDYFPADTGSSASNSKHKTNNILDIIEGLASGAAAAKGVYDLMNGENVQQSFDAIR